MSEPVNLIDFVADPVCPWCFVGLHSLRRVTTDDPALSSAQVRYRPYYLNPGLPEEGVDRKAYYEKKFPDAQKRAQSRQALIDAAQLAGVEFDPGTPQHLPNTKLAHLLIQFAQAAAQGGQVSADQLVNSLYDAFWLDGQDIGNQEVLLNLAGEAGLNAAQVTQFFEESQDPDNDPVSREAWALSLAGVSGVPTFIVNGETGFSGALPPRDLGPALKSAARQTNASYKDP
ncbi:MAG: DsbA family oxidoreductase [Pseudomonadota bacterium]